MGEGECGSCSGNGGCASSGSCSAPQLQKLAKPSPSPCIKCKDSPAMAMANQTESICASCLRTGVLSKLKTVLNTHAHISAADKILVAFSGGPASRVLLELLNEIRENALASRALNAPSFALEVAFVDEGAAIGIAEHERSHAGEEIRRIVSGLKLPLHVIRLENIMKGGDDQPEKRFRDLLSSVKDSTGKEDLVEILRMESLDELAREMGFTKVMLGWSTTRIAARVVSATAKGQGFSLAAGVHHVDARWFAPVILPLRDCASKELALICHHFKLETLFIRNSSTLAESPTINSLCNSFVLTLREDNSARDHTIVRTAGKLSQFGFNQLHSGRKKRGGGDQLRAEENYEFRSFCSLCRDPIEEDSSEKNSSDNLSSFRDSCCSSCRFQILDDGDEVSGLLPQGIQSRGVNRDLLRAQIQDFLI